MDAKSSEQEIVTRPEETILALPYDNETGEEFEAIATKTSEDIVNDVLDLTTTKKPGGNWKKKIATSFDSKLAQSSLSFGIGILEHLRWSVHHDPKILKLAQGTPVLTTGIAGFVDRHIGDMWETLAAFTLLDLSLEVGSLVTEKLSGKKLTSDQKFAISLIGSSLAVSATELGVLAMKGNTHDPLDTFGVAVAALVLTGSYKLVYSDKSPWGKEYKKAHDEQPEE